MAAMTGACRTTLRAYSSVLIDAGMTAAADRHEPVHGVDDHRRVFGNGVLDQPGRSSAPGR